MADDGLGAFPQLQHNLMGVLGVLVLIHDAPTRWMLPPRQNGFVADELVIVHLFQQRQKQAGVRNVQSTVGLGKRKHLKMNNMRYFLQKWAPVIQQVGRFLGLVDGASA